jgi:hypothetical protein
MKKLLLAVALAPFALGFSMANATSVTTDPVGFVKINVQPGLQTAGVSLVRPAVAAGRVASSNGTSITLEGAVELPAGAHYVEIVKGEGSADFVGERFEVQSASGNVITVNTGSARNTISLNGVNLKGYSVVVRPHVTLAHAFGDASNPILTSATSATNADQVMLYNQQTNGFDIYWFRQDPFNAANKEWRLLGQNASENGRVIAPGTGTFLLRRGTSAAELVMLGEVRTTDRFRQNFAPGLNLIAEAFPLDHSPVDRWFNSDNGFRAATSSASADQIQVFNAQAGGYDIYWYRQDPFNANNKEWRLLGQNTSSSLAKLMKADRAVFVLKREGDNAYEAPRTF